MQRLLFLSYVEMLDPIFVLFVLRKKTDKIKRFLVGVRVRVMIFLTTPQPWKIFSKNVRLNWLFFKKKFFFSILDNLENKNLNQFGLPVTYVNSSQKNIHRPRNSHTFSQINTPRKKLFIRLYHSSEKKPFPSSKY